VSSMSAKGSSKGKASLFGVELADQVEMENSEIPKLVTECTRLVEKKGLEMEGIYRLSGSTAKVRSYKQQLSMNFTPDLEAELDPANITSLLKDYFRELPTSLITPPVYHQILSFLGACLLFSATLSFLLISTQFSL